MRPATLCTSFQAFEIPVNQYSDGYWCEENLQQILLGQELVLAVGDDKVVDGDANTGQVHQYQKDDVSCFHL